ncbi:MAG TPA: A24 family peptidase [Steroidobacteraceae bacterium]|nr:A24 family peptidase [Steroidobacteraceae bacterium]
MEMLELLSEHPVLFTVVVALFSLLIGSFLNVVIHRLPIMLERAWRSEAAAIVSEPPAYDLPDVPRYNLVVPRSCCPTCKAPITALQNIPVISYLFLRGKCAQCSTPISARYPIIELVTAVLSAVVAYKFGLHWQTAAALLMTWCLVALFMIDLNTQFLPDQMTLPLMWIGLIMSLYAVPGSSFAADPRSSIIGGAVGYLSLWSVYWVFKLLTGKEGMGHGDFKLLAAFGTWFGGWESILLIVLLSSLAGSVIGIGLILFRGRDHNIPMPYGPFLAIAGWIAMLWGSQILDVYAAVSHPLAPHP